MSRFHDNYIKSNAHHANSITNFWSKSSTWTWFFCRVQLSNGITRSSQQHKISVEIDEILNVSYPMVIDILITEFFSIIIITLFFSIRSFYVASTILFLYQHLNSWLLSFFTLRFIQSPEIDLNSFHSNVTNFGRELKWTIFSFVTICCRTLRIENTITNILSILWNRQADTIESIFTKQFLCCIVLFSILK